LVREVGVDPLGVDRLTVDPCAGSAGKQREAGVVLEPGSGTDLDKTATTRSDPAEDLADDPVLSFCEYTLKSWRSRRFGSSSRGSASKRATSARTAVWVLA
jgi:hypothetical protein